MVLEHDYKWYIGGKRVAFIGPAPNLIGKGLGEFFDSFDICVRTNHAIELLNDYEYQKDYGKKCHILYTNNQYYREMRPFPVQQWTRRGLEWLCMKKAAAFDRKNYQRVMRVRKVTDTLEQYTKRIPSLLMGVVVIAEILECHPGYFYVDGIDFNMSRPKVWSNDQYPEYIKGYLPDKIIEKAREINTGKTDDGHDPIANTMEIYRLYKRGGFDMPEHLKQLLLDVVEGRVCQK